MFQAPGFVAADFLTGVFYVAFHLFQQVYFGKTRDVVFDLRSVDDLEKVV